MRLFFCADRPGGSKINATFIRLLIATATAGCLSVQSSLHAAPPSSDYNLFWSDEFNGAANTSVNSSTWLVGNYVPTNRDAAYTPNAVYHDGLGNLKIKTWSEPKVGGGWNHKTGFIESAGKFEHKFGYWEARIDFDSSPGMWSAFWLDSPERFDFPGNPERSGFEIDVMEHRAVNSSQNNISNLVESATHWTDVNNQIQTRFTEVNKPGLSNGFHLYALEWTPTELIFYYDGQEYWRMNEVATHRAQYALLTSEVKNNSWAGDIPAGGYGSFAATTTRMRVDYVRVFDLPPIVLSNAGFENGTGITAETTDQWFNYGGGSEATNIRGTGNAHGGDYSGITGQYANPAINTDHTIAAGDQFNLSLWHRNNSAADDREVNWELYYYTDEFDAGFDETSDTSLVSLFSGTYTAGASGDGTAWAQLIAPTTTTIGAIDAAIGKTLYLRFFRTDESEGDFPRVDDVNLSLVVPEPASLALMSMGGLWLLRRRRRAACRGDFTP